MHSVVNKIHKLVHLNFTGSGLEVVSGGVMGVCPLT